jgi:hypothetical protein
MENQTPFKAYAIIHSGSFPIGWITKIKARVIYIDYPTDGPVLNKKLVMGIVSADGKIYLKKLVANMIGQNRRRDEHYKMVKARFGLLGWFQKMDIARLGRIL